MATTSNAAHRSPHSRPTLGLAGAIQAIVFTNWTQKQLHGTPTSQATHHQPAWSIYGPWIPIVPYPMWRSRTLASAVVADGADVDLVEIDG